MLKRNQDWKLFNGVLYLVLTVLAVWMIYHDTASHARGLLIYTDGLFLGWFARSFFNAIGEYVDARIRPACCDGCDYCDIPE